MIETQIEELLAALSLEEKAMLCTGKDFWHLHGIERLNLPAIMVTDGPHGLRKQAGEGDHVGLNESVKATCFPTASGLAASWNTGLIHDMGVALGRECRAEDVSVLLGPGINMKRNPLGGRNFEYFSEDPLLAGSLSTAWIQGVQSQQVGTSLKHYAVNNHEHCRMTVDAIVDQRTLREIYLPAFEQAVTQSQPWSVMCSYNKVNGTYLAEHKQLLNDILFEQWRYEGIVVTDWGANNDRVAGVKNGQTLEMPGSGDTNTKKIIAAVESGELTMAELDKSVGRLLNLILKSKAALDGEKVDVDLDAHHRLAAKIAEETCVLLKNDDDFLPVAKGIKVAVIGELASNTRYQGAGSSKINPHKLELPLDEIKKIFGEANVSYTAGYALNDVDDAQEIANAVKIAEQADVVFIFAGLTPKYESEGFDRTHLRLPQVQLDLFDALAPHLTKTTVILQNGAPIEMPFVDQVPAILEAYLGGQAGASAIAKVLAGDVNPSGKLAETFPMALADVPSQPYFPGTTKQVQYRESIWMGYRYFDSAKQSVLFPFGHGLSYTTFDYSDFEIQGDAAAIELSKDGVVNAKVTVTNSGERAGAEVVQIYIGQEQPSVPRPNKELKAYAKVFLQPGESKVVEFTLDYRAFAFWCVNRSTWIAESDDYKVYVGASVADIRAQSKVAIRTDYVQAEVNDKLRAYFEPEKRDFSDAAFSAILGQDIPAEPAVLPFTMNSTMGEIAQTEVGGTLYDALMSSFAAMMGGDSNEAAAEADRLMAESMVKDMPLRNVALFNPQQFTESQVLGLLDEMNASGAS